MEIKPTPLKDCYVIHHDLHGDDRGYFMEAFNRTRFKKFDLDFSVEQINIAKRRSHPKNERAGYELRFASFPRRSPWRSVCFGGGHSFPGFARKFPGLTVDISKVFQCAERMFVEMPRVSAKLKRLLTNEVLSSNVMSP